MTNMTLSIPEDLHKIMQKYREIKWSEVAREALWTKANKLELMDKLLTNSKLTEEDVLEIGRKVNAGIARKHGMKK